MIPYGRQSIDEDDIRAVTDVLRSDFLTCGPKVEEFERAFADSCGARHAVACANGTAALHLAMLAAEIGPGDRVVTTPNTFLASANCATFVGATPDFADIDPVSYCLSPDDLEARWKSDTRAVVAVDFAGQPAEMPRIAEIAHRNGAVVIEDACHAVGGRFVFDGEEHRVGGHPWADISTYSFHPVKTLTTGEGGMLVTDNDEYADRARRFRNHGMTRNTAEWGGPLAPSGETEAPWYYEMPEAGFNYRITDLQCALGLAQLERLPEFIRRRREIVAAYNEAFADLPHLATPRLAPWLESEGTRPGISWHLYVVRIDFNAIGQTRGAFMNALAARGIGTQVHYIPVHRQPYYQSHLGDLNLPAAEAYYEKCLSLPLYQGMTDDDVTTVIRTVSELIG